MRRAPSSLLASFGWAALGCAALPVVLPPLAGYRTAVAAAAIFLFSLALAAPRPAFAAALVSVTAAGASALAFGAKEPASAGPLLLFGYLAGAALREVYEPHTAPLASPVVLAWRAFAVLSAVSGVATFVGFRTSYLLSRGVPPPRTVNLLGEDAARAAPAVLLALLPIVAAAGLARAASRLARESDGRVWLDRALLASGALAGGVGILQKVGALPMLRSARWADWHRAQSTFTDPSAAGVAVVLLATPLLAGAAAGGRLRRFASAASGAALLVVLADSGSRAGLVGTITAALVFVLWGLTRLAAGDGGGTRRRVAATIGTLSILGAFALAAAVSWPGPGGRSALYARVEALLRTEPAPFEQTRGRVLLYEAGWEIFREHPVAGLGLGSFQMAFPDVAAEKLHRPVKTTDHPPSLYLGTLAESGLAGAALLALLLLGLARGAGRALGFGTGHGPGPLGDAAAAASVIGLLVVFLFGSHLVYPEVAAWVAVLTSRLPLREDGRTARLLTGLVPVVLAGALACALGGVAARALDTRTPDAAFRFAPDAGVWAPEAEPDGRAFRWTAAAAAWRIPGALQASTAVLPVRNARPDGRPVALDVWVDDVLRGRVTLPGGSWRRLEVPVPAATAPVVLRVAVAESFRPPAHDDLRDLGIETGVAPTLRQTP
ncbi:MAG: O-antigen ligase family protein [Acidobacteriota bacterium]